MDKWTITVENMSTDQVINITRSLICDMMENCVACEKVGCRDICVEVDDDKNMSDMDKINLATRLIMANPNVKYRECVHVPDSKDKDYNVWEGIVDPDRFCVDRTINRSYNRRLKAKLKRRITQ